MALSVSCLRVRQRVNPIASGWNAGSYVLLEKPDAQRVAVVPLVQDRHPHSEALQELSRMVDIRLVARSKEQHPRNAIGIDRRVHFGIPSAFRQPYGLIFPA